MASVHHADAILIFCDPGDDGLLGGLKRVLGGGAAQGVNPAAQLHAPAESSKSLPELILYQVVRKGADYDLRSVHAAHVNMLYHT